MPTYPFMQVDAFTTRPLGGNPCAILFDADNMAAETMQAIAREMNLSETAFVRRSAQADFGVRYFTPAEESGVVKMGCRTATSVKRNFYRKTGLRFTLDGSALSYFNAGGDFAD